MILPTTGFWNAKPTVPVILDRILLNGGILTDLGDGEYMAEPNPSNFTAYSMNMRIYTNQDVDTLSFDFMITGASATVIFDIRRGNYIPIRPRLNNDNWTGITWDYPPYVITKTVPLQFNVNNSSYSKININTRFYIKNIREL